MKNTFIFNKPKKLIVLIQEVLKNMGDEIRVRA
jgi:hypothetical protein